MIKSLATRIVVLILALWLPVQGIAAVSVSFCEVGMGDGAKSMSTDGMKEPCQHTPAMCSGGNACKLRLSCSFCSAGIAYGQIVIDRCGIYRLPAGSIIIINGSAGQCQSSKIGREITARLSTGGTTQ